MEGASNAERQLDFWACEPDIIGALSGANQQLDAAARWMTLGGNPVQPEGRDTLKCPGRSATLINVAGSVECRFDPSVHGVLLPVQATRVAPVQHLDGVAGPPGHFGWWHAGVEPAGQAGVPKVVRTASEG